jgi:hypothetical protein
MGRKQSLPELSNLKAVQLTLDLPQFRIRPGSRVLSLESGKTGRVSCWHLDHIISFPGGQIKSVPRHLLVQIQ